MQKEVVNLDTGERLYFDAVTPYEAMTKCAYYLGLKNHQKEITINKTVSGYHLWLEHMGQTYSVRN